MLCQYAIYVHELVFIIMERKEPIVYSVFQLALIVYS